MYKFQYSREEKSSFRYWQKHAVETISYPPQFVQWQHQLPPLTTTESRGSRWKHHLRVNWYLIGGLVFFSLCKQVRSKRIQLAIRQVVAVVARIMLNNNEWVSWKPKWNCLCPASQEFWFMAEETYVGSSVIGRRRPGKTRCRNKD